MASLHDFSLDDALSMVLFSGLLPEDTLSIISPDELSPQETLSMVLLDELPPEILESILTSIDDAQSIGRSALVCKKWAASINSIKQFFTLQADTLLEIYNGDLEYLFKNAINEKKYIFAQYLLNNGIGNIDGYEGPHCKSNFTNLAITRGCLLDRIVNPENQLNNSEQPTLHKKNLLLLSFPITADQLEFLLKHGAHPNIIGDRKITPLEHAIAECSFDTEADEKIKLFCNYGATVLGAENPMINRSMLSRICDAVRNNFIQADTLRLFIDKLWEQLADLKDGETLTIADTENLCAYDKDSFYILIEAELEIAREMQHPILISILENALTKNEMGG